jgi:uncharacterized protein
LQGFLPCFFSSPNQIPAHPFFKAFLLYNLEIFGSKQSERIKKMNRVVHFEISADDLKRAVEFYSKVFDWKIEQWGSSDDYWLTIPPVKNARGIDGAITKRTLPPGSGTVITISVDNIETIVEKVKQAGGKQMTEIEEIPTIGLFCYCEDSESNHIGLIQISNYDTEGC